MNCDIGIKKIELGERREVTLTVWLASGENFSVDSATWTLSRDDVESSGSCDTNYENNAYTLTALIEPQNRGRYKLTYTFNIASEIIKRTAVIDVI